MPMTPDGSLLPSDSARPLLRRRHRLRSSRDIRQTYEQGQRNVGRFMVMWIRREDDAHCRLGVVASKKVGNAIKRNRAKRRIREVFRLHRHLLIPEIDLVMVCRHRAVDAEWTAICEEFITLARQAGVLKPEATAN